MCSPITQTLQKEIQGHQPRIDDIFERSQNIITDSSLNAEAIRQRLADLKQLWGLLIPPPYSLEVQQGGNSGTGNPRTP